MAQHAGACVGRHHGPAPARALEEPGACRALERGDLQADRRLGVAELLGRTGERAGGDDGLERHQVPHLDAEQSMSFFIITVTNCSWTSGGSCPMLRT